MESRKQPATKTATTTGTTKSTPQKTMEDFECPVCLNMIAEPV